jgi:hypothetical protein
MHDLLSEILQREVVGKVTQVGGVFFDVALGRLCLDRLDRAEIDEVIARLAARFGDELDLFDRLHLEEADRLLRGRVDVTLRDPESGGSYLLQISTREMLAFHERRLPLAPGQLGDLSGTVALGIGGWLGESPEAGFRELSGFDELRKRYLEHQDRVLQAAVTGTPIDAAEAVADLAEAVRRAWALVPWSVKVGLSPVFEIGEDRITGHDQTHRRTIILAVDVLAGRLAYQYAHQHVEGEAYLQVQGWMSDVYATVLDAYQGAAHAVAMARASSIERFVDHFPAFRKVVGLPAAMAAGLTSEP